MNPCIAEAESCIAEAGNVDRTPTCLLPRATNEQITNRTEGILLGTGTDHSYNKEPTGKDAVMQNITF